MFKPEHQHEEVDFSEGSTAKVGRTVRCMSCKAHTRITLDLEKLKRWENKEYVQVVWPDLTLDQRELIMTGMHKDCWDYTFQDYDDEQEVEEIL